MKPDTTFDSAVEQDVMRWLPLLVACFDAPASMPVTNAG